MAARAKAEAVRSLDRGDFAAGALLQAAKVHMIAAPASAVMDGNGTNALANLDADLAAGDVKRAKRATTKLSGPAASIFSSTEQIITPDAAVDRLNNFQAPNFCPWPNLPQGSSALIGCWHCDFVHVHPL